MGNDIEASPQTARVSDIDANSLKSADHVGRQELAEIVHPHASYEGHHRFDPHASWSEEEERRVVRKTDLRLLTWLCLMMFGLQESCRSACGLNMSTDFSSSIAETCRMHSRTISSKISS